MRLRIRRTVGREESSRPLSDRSLVVAIVAVGVSLCTVILATDDGAKIDALDAKIDGLDVKIDAKIGALDAKIDAKIGALDAKIDALDAKVDDIRVYIAAKHGERVSFTPDKAGSVHAWTVRSIDAKTGKPRQIGTLEVQGGSERRAVLKIGKGNLTREWIHLGNADTLERARTLAMMAVARAENR